MAYTTRNENQRTGAGTRENPLTDIQIQDLNSQGIKEGGYVPGKGTLSPLGTFAPAVKTSGGSTPVVAPTSPTSPTVANTMSGIRGLNYQTDPGTIDTYQKAPSEDQVRRQQMKLFQTEIDATNQVYDQMLNQERLAGQGREGTQRAMSARSGLLGSDFGESNRIGTQNYNLGQERAIQAERQAKVGSIMGTMRKAVADELKEKREARQSGYDAHVAYLRGGDERKANNSKTAASAILAAGLDPAALDPAELKAIAKEGGLSTEQIIFSYNELKNEQAAAQAESDLKTRKAEADISKIEADIAKGKLIELSEGGMIYNPETGETFKNPKTSAPGTGTGTGLKVGGKTLDPTQVSDVHQTLQENRGQDGYTDTGKYMDELEGFVSMGGDPKDFIKEYSPDVYINPKDPSRSFLESQMKKQTSNSTLGFGELSFESL